MQPHFFPDQSDFRKWLDKNHDKETELLVGFYKVSSGKPSMNWPESVDQALCYGWIDGVRRSIDNESYTIRFTPRKSVSIWSAVNIDKIEKLTKAKLMKPAGIAAYEKRKDSHSKIYSHENDTQMSAEFEARFKANKKAWEFFCAQPAGYRKTATHIIMSPKQEATRVKWLEILMKDCENGKRLDRINWKKAT